MPTLEEVKEQVKALQDRDISLNKFLTKKEINELPNILWDDEQIVDLIAGIYGNGNGLLVATNKRLVFVDKGMLWGLRVEDFPYDKISSIQYQKHLLSGSITIFTSGNKAEIKQATKDLCASFCEHVRAMITKVQQNNIDNNIKAEPTNISIPDNNDDIISKLERLGTLKQQGLLTDEEFISAKKKILGGE